MKIISKVGKAMYKICIIAFLVVLLLSFIVAVASKWYSFHINVSESLKGTLYVIKKGSAVSKGELVGFVWTKETNSPYEIGSTFIKYLSGEEGDVVTTYNRDVYLNSKFIAKAKTRAFSGRKLQIIKDREIPKGFIFVSTPAKDGYDSRYEEFGFIDRKNIIGKAYEIF